MKVKVEINDIERVLEIPEKEISLLNWSKVTELRLIKSFNGVLITAEEAPNWMDDYATE